MEDSSNDIKKEFEEKIKYIEENEEKSKIFKTTLLYSSSIILFIIILIGTIFSYSNYIKTKNKVANQTEIPKIVIKG